MQSKLHSNQSTENPGLNELLRTIREEALRGSRSVAPASRIHLHDEAASIVMLELVERMAREARASGVPPLASIRSLKHYARRAGRNAALRLLREERRFVSLEGMTEGGGAGSDQHHVQLDLWAGVEEPNLVVREEMVEALPALLSHALQSIAKMADEDADFFQLYFMEGREIEEIESNLAISRKSVLQRWRRLVVGLRSRFMTDLRTWDIGWELFGDIFRDADRFVELLFLLRVLVEEGIEAVVKALDCSRDKK